MNTRGTYFRMQDKKRLIIKSDFIQFRKQFLRNLLIYAFFVPNQCIYFFYLHKK